MENLSIVIPTYKEEESIKKCIYEIRKKHKGEVIIVDDSPDKKTKEAVEKIKDNNIIFIKNKKLEGLSGSVLKGIKKQGMNS